LVATFVAAFVEWVECNERIDKGCDKVYDKGPIVMPNDDSNTMRLAAIILAAGRSARMGKPKMLLPWAGTSVIGHLLAQWSRVGAKQAALVCAENDQPMATELDRLGFPNAGRIYNPLPDRGMFSSIQCAARWPGWSEGITHWAVVLGDQPHLRDETLHDLLGFAAAHPGEVCQPRQGGHRHHPVILPKPVFEKLADTTSPDLKDFLNSCEAAQCDLDDPGLALDIDRPEDYERALALAMVQQPHIAQASAPAGSTGVSPGRRRPRRDAA
jgi:molybdenum cofactor cytidylyltransferase